MKELTCCFTGHRIISKEDMPFIKDKIKEEAEALINKGILYFGAGGALGFDMYAAEAVLELRNKYPSVRLVLVLPSRDYDNLWSDSQRKRYSAIRESADKITYVEEKYKPGCMHKRNRHLVDHSSVCIAYIRKEKGGTYYTVKYAKEHGLKIINI